MGPDHGVGEEVAEERHGALLHVEPFHGHAVDKDTDGATVTEKCSEIGGVLTE